MFVGREKELIELERELLNWSHKTAVLVYGKRRVGKSTLVNKAADSFDGIVVNHLCVSSSFEGNLEMIYKSVATALSLPLMSFESIYAMMDYLGTLDKKILLILDEYPYLKQTKKQGEVDSVFQAVIDRLPDNVKIILCGSYITVMKELLEESNPLFGRFSLILHIREFDYYDSSKFYPNLSPRDKVSMYAVFGGSPYVLENIDTSISLSDNIIKQLMPETGIIRTHVENIMIKEIQKSFDSRILEALGNGKKRYSEISNWMKGTENGLLDKQLKILLDMEAVRKVEPINRQGDKKKQFYEIVDNLMRFYFAFIFGNAGRITRIGPEQYFRNNMDEQLREFISRRFEDIALQFFHRRAISGKLSRIEDFGSYWYDDPSTKTNGEFDCVLKRNGGKYEFYECKFYDRKMTMDECIQEEEQIKKVNEIKVSNIGFINVSGFAFEDSDKYTLVDGGMLYE